MPAFKSLLASYHQDVATLNMEVIHILPLQNILYISIISMPDLTSAPELLGVLKSRSYLLSAAQMKTNL
jgi:hypothetical protein